MIKTLEYMGLAKPVVAFDLVETRISCGPSALYAHGDSPDHLADLVVALADDPGLRRRLGSEGRRRIEAQLAWRHGERRLLALYDRLTRSGEDVQRIPVETVRDVHAAGAEERRRKVHQR
jgi:glycosyltransferase involved in cell wall biosynthesis